LDRLQRFPFRPAGAPMVPSCTATQDGQRFLLSAIVDPDARAPLSVVQNWTAGVGR
jgi:hypothetical protein